MTLSIRPWAVYEFENNNVDSMGVGPTLSTIATTYGTGRTGQGIQSFSSATKDPSSPLPDFTGDLSVCFWLETRTEDIADFGVGAAEVNSLTRGIQLNVTYGPTGFTDLSGFVNSLNFSTSWLQAMIPGWQFFVITKTAAGAVVILQNGTQRYTGSGATGTNTGSERIALGSNDGAVGPRLDQLAIFEGILSAGDQAEIYNSGNGLAWADWDYPAAPAAAPSTTTYDRTILLRR